MPFERVYMVWELYDGVRSGIALFQGSPHYFSSEVDVVSDDGYSDAFRLWPIDQSFLALAREQWALYKNWEYRHHSGEVPVETHPGHRGLNPRYDELEDHIQHFLSELGAPTTRANAAFQRLADQPPLPYGCLLEIEVEWSVVA